MSRVQTVEITSKTVLRGDVIMVGGQPLRVIGLRDLYGGAKRLIFHTGEILTLHRSTRLEATRLVPPGVRAFRHNGKPIPSTPEHLRKALNDEINPEEGR